VEHIAISDYSRFVQKQPEKRFLVPDLSPRDRVALRHVKPRFLFVAESPHVSEVEPESKEERRPLCGAAGKVWWNALSKVIEGKPSSDLSLSFFLDFCKQHRIAVLNAVQIPLDPKVMRLFPLADPVKIIGFSKELGTTHYKKFKDRPEMKKVLNDLRERLNDPSVKSVPVLCLGNDSLWFVERALGEEGKSRLLGKIAHPSAWWRKGGLFERAALESLSRLFSK
jgi:hypothetical protein